MARNKKLNTTSLSRVAIGKILSDAGLKARIAKRTFKLTEKQKQKRLEWAEKFMGKRRDFWEKVWWSDESKLFTQKSGNIYIRKFDEENWDSDEFVEEEQKFHEGKEILVWGAISENGPIDIVLIDGSQNSDKYIELLNNHLIKN